ncbi:MAG: ATP-dependent RNA helicase HrpA [Polyangiaceae bacterium]
MSEIPSARSEDMGSPLRFPSELPISARVRDIARAIDEHPVVIVSGATGSGKTTQLPKIALAMGRGVAKRIGVTQPRRIAATSVAARVASEVGTPVGTEVGYKVRFDDRTSEGTYVKFMTDGILLAEIQGDPLLRQYDTLIIDEAHERSLTIDFLLGWVKRILPKRPDLKVVVSSATLETHRFSEFFGGAPVLEVEGRMYPVDVLYEPPPPEADLADAVAGAIENVTSLDPRGDILAFLPGEREIRETEAVLRTKNLRHTVVQALYARLSVDEQKQVFAAVAGRRVILATNVAETSLTIPGIVYVVDTGLARLSRYDSRSGTTRLQIEGISQASADQRKGRCGRVRDGICIRLYDEPSFAARPAFTDPEIKRTGLAGVILRMKSLGLGDVKEFPFVDPPHSRAISEGYSVLEELGALGPERELTPVGERLARFPVDPRVGRMILAGAEHGCLRDVLIVAAALSTQDPRERPRAAQPQADERHKRFRDERSEFVGLLRLWEFAREAESRGTSALRRACKDNYISFLRVREWSDVHRQLEEVADELGLTEPNAKRQASVPSEGTLKTSEPFDALHIALLTGLLSRIGHYHAENRVYVGARQTRFSLHPSSSLARKPPAWVMAFELVETTQLFARMAAKIEPEWLHVAAPHLLKRSYSDPHWSEKSARACVKEQATLFGVPVFRDRNVDYETVAPTAAWQMFIDHALVRGEYRSRGAFQAKNAELLAEVARLRDKARRSDMMADGTALAAVFEARVPSHVTHGKAFEVWREAAEAQNPSILHLSMRDVLAGDPGLVASDYPDSVTLRGVVCPVAYRFDPSAEDDGITVTVPLPLLYQLAPDDLCWTIPGWHRDKIAALLHELPRAYRRELEPVQELSALLADVLLPFQGRMIPALARAIAEIREVEIPEEAFRPDAVADYLRLTCRIVGEEGRVIAQGKDLETLWTEHRPRARDAWQEAAPDSRWERKGITGWDFGDLEPFVTRRLAGTEFRAYPAIVDRGASVDLVLMESECAANTAAREGVRRLLMLAVHGTLSTFEPRIPQAFARSNGNAPSRTDNEAFRAAALARIVDDAFRLDDDAPLPRTRLAFDDVLARGSLRVSASFERLVMAIARASSELDATLRALRSASKHPTAKNAIADIRSHLEWLFPADLLGWVPLACLDHYPRYLRAAQVRVGRAIADPRKDSEKFTRMAPLWTDFVERQATARPRGTAHELRWDFEELRVAIFAPELKTARPVSIEKLRVELAGLR